MADDLDPGPLADVDLVDDTLVLTRKLGHSPETVWRALTDPAWLPEWAPFTADRDLGTPGAATLHMTDGQDTDLPTVVRRAEPPDVLEYTWGGDVLCWQPTGSRLVLRHTIADREQAPAMAAGWHLCLAVLQRLLDGDPVGPIVGEDAMKYGWDDLREQYAKVLFG